MCFGWPGNMAPVFHGSIVLLRILLLVSDDKTACSTLCIPELGCNLMDCSLSVSYYSHSCITCRQLQFSHVADVSVVYSIPLIVWKQYYPQKLFHSHTVFNHMRILWLPQLHYLFTYFVMHMSSGSVYFYKLRWGATLSHVLVSLMFWSLQLNYKKL